MHRIKEENYEYIEKRGKAYFGPATCRDATYDCRVKKQYMQIVYETNKLRELFDRIHDKFLKAIDHMEFHPTLGKEKKGTSYKLHKHSTENRDASVANQMKYLSPDDIEMLRKGNKIIQKRYLNVNNTKHQTKRFDLATQILGWGIYRNAHNIMSIKKNIQNLYDHVTGCKWDGGLIFQFGTIWQGFIA